MIDEHAATELKLYIDNDSALHRQQHVPIQKNLATKKVTSKYKHDLAVKLFGYLVEAGAKKYAKEFGGTWHQMFNVPTRKRVAEELTRDFEGEFELGNYDNLLPKKYQVEMVTGTKRFPGRGHATKKGAGKSKWKTPESLKIVWSPGNQSYLALWPGRGRIEDQQVLKNASSNDMHEWLRDTYGIAYGLASRASHSTRRTRTPGHGHAVTRVKKSPAQLNREIAAALSRPGRR